MRHGTTGNFSRVQVYIAHPRLVCLGLNLWAFPNILFYETGYSLYTLRQASRRSWRIGQTQDVSVKYFAYAKTAQEICLRLMGKKLLVALAMEGKFSAEGLQAVAENDDLLMAMARELVTKQRIGESAEMVWRDIQAQNAAIIHADRRLAEPALDVERIPYPEIPESPTQLPSGVADQLVLFGASLATTSSRRRAPCRSSSGLAAGEKQLVLF